MIILTKVQRDKLINDNNGNLQTGDFNKDGILRQPIAIKNNLYILPELFPIGNLDYLEIRDIEENEKIEVAE